jgi:cation diffusion facilitator CzcD-associated flavoprotein CzcO
VSHHYDHWDDYPGQSVVVVGGGRSADWAATEFHDAGRTVVYVMRQPKELQARLIDESQHLPYYARLRAIVDSGTTRFRRLFRSRVVAFEVPNRVLIDGPGGPEMLTADHVIIEIGGEPDIGFHGAAYPAAADILHNLLPG